MNHAELVAQLARGECAHLFTLRARSIAARDAATFALTALRESEIDNALRSGPERWRAFTAALDAWPHEAPLGHAPALEAALAEWSDHERALPLRWLHARIAGAPSPFASLARSLELSADSPEALCALLEGALRALPRGAFRALSLFLPKSSRSAADLSALPALVARCEGLTHLGACLPLRAADLGALLASARALGVASFGFTVATTLYRSLLKSKHLAGVRALTLWMNDSAEDAERASAFLDLLAASPCLSTLEELGLRQGGFDDEAIARLATLPLPSLASLDLSYNRFGAAGVEALTAARWWPALRSLTLNWVRKGSFDRLGDKGLAPMLARPPAELERLSLHGNDHRRVASFVERLPRLTTLDLQHNDVAPGDAMALLAHPTLEVLNLGGSSIDERSVPTLVTEVTPGPSLRALHLAVTTERISSDLALASVSWAKRVGLRAPPRVLSWLWARPGMALTYRVLNGRHDDDTLALAASPALAQVSTLSLSWEYQPEPAKLRALLSSPHLRGLESLDLRFGEYWSARPLVAAFGAANLPALRSLTLRSLAGATERESSEGAAPTLRPLAEEARVPALREIHLCDAKLSARELSTLAAGASLAALEALHVQGRPEGALASVVDAAAEVVRARALRAFSLHLDTYPPGACEALRDPTWTRSLERLSLHIPWDSLAPTARFDAPRCRALALAHLPGERLACFENLPVEELSLRFGHNGSAALMALPAWRLRSLSLPRSTLSAAQLATMREAGWLSSVERLDLSACLWNAETLAAFASSTKLGRVQHLSLGKVLHLKDAVTRMLDSDALPSLRSLTFDPDLQHGAMPAEWRRARPELKIVSERGESW